MSNYRKTDLTNLSRIFKALSNRSRLKIFLRLTDCDVLSGLAEDGGKICACVGDLGSDLDLAPSTVSHHIKELRQSGLIDLTRRGQHVECRVSPEVVKMLADFFAEAAQLGKCCGPKIGDK